MENGNEMIRIEHLRKRYGDLQVLDDINLTIKRGEKLVILGPSGSGKSTLIRCINHLEKPTSGEIYIGGELVTQKNWIQMSRDHMAMVFQQFNLYPHKTVLQNLTMAPIKLHKVPKKEAEKTAMEYLDRVMICVTHEMGFARQVADRVIFLDSAKIVEEGTPEEVFGNPKNERTKIFFSKILH